jgi:hypothetical protein
MKTSDSSPESNYPSAAKKRFEASHHPSILDMAYVVITDIITGVFFLAM